MRSKKPLLLILAVSILAAFSVYNYIGQINVWKDSFALHVLQREKHLEAYLEMSEALAKAGHYDDISHRLERARKERFIDFYILQYKGEPVFWGPNDRLDALNIGYVRLNEPVIEEKFTLYSLPLDDDHVLTAGIYKNVDAYLDLSLKEFRATMLEELLFFSGIALAVFAYYIRDILAILRQFRSGKARDYSRIKAKSRESDMILSGLAGYEQAVHSLILQNETLGNQVLPSLKKEILSGKKPPYDFACTLVRTDINNFSQIFHTHDVSVFMGEINEFFKEVSHAVARYKGMVHEFVGDEVIFYFKDEDHPNSFATAVSAVRDINSVAERFHRRTLRAHGYPFTVKSSLAHGTMRFGPLVNGFSLAGSILIETVRILSQVVEKDGNVVYFESAHLSKAEDILDVQAAGEVKLKGFTGKKTLYCYRSHKPLHLILENLTEENVDQLTYYRNDSDLAETLRFFKGAYASISLPVLLRAIQVLRSFVVTQSDGSPALELIEWLETMKKSLTHSSASRVEKRVTRLISAASMLFINLVPRDVFSNELDARLSKFMKMNDKRIVANVLEVLTHFKSETEPEFLKSLIDHENNRVAANALVHEGQRSLDPAIIKYLAKMLSSKDDSTVASGLYVLGELAGYHRKRDIVYYSTQLEFLRLVRDLPGFVNINHGQVVRRQALIAAKKADDTAVIDLIRTRAIQDHSEILIREIDELLPSDPLPGTSSPLKAA